MDHKDELGWFEVKSTDGEKRIWRKMFNLLRMVGGRVNHVCCLFYILFTIVSNEQPPPDLSNADVDANDEDATVENQHPNAARANKIEETLKLASQFHDMVYLLFGDRLAADKACPEFKIFLRPQELHELESE